MKSLFALPVRVGALCAVSAAAVLAACGESPAPGAGTATTEGVPTDMFGAGDDLFTRRKREAAEGGNTISHS